MKKVKLPLLLAAIAITSLIACKKDSDPVPSTITDIVVGNPDFSILAKAVSRAGLADALKTTPNLTVFAPNNAAFTAAGITDAAIETLPQAALVSILQYHVVPAVVRSTNIAAGASNAPTLLTGNNIFLSNYSGGIFINGKVRVVSPDLAADNGIIHVVNNVIMPPSGNIVAAASATPSLSLLVQAVVKCGLQDALSAAGNLTVFAPTNAAFEAAGFNSAAITAATGTTLNTLRSVLLLHVLNGRVFSTDISGTVTAPTLLEGSQITAANSATVRGPGNTTPANISAANVLTTNGVVHIIDRVLLP